MTLNKKILFVFACFCFMIAAKAQDTLFFDKYNNQHTGTYLKDFGFVLQGSDSVYNLYSLQADTVMILFYDPYCDHCHDAIKKLKKDKALKQSIMSKSVIFLTVPPDITFEQWEQTVKHMPKLWLNAWSKEYDLITGQFLWKVPELFVLDKDFKILYIDMYNQQEDE
ncbi:MAG: hypothetical protein J6M30_05455 [Bacteroidales bacterium]|nr:hypothetical protein [Bacteroidales bacterium]